MTAPLAPFTISRESPLSEDVALLMKRHHETMHALSPPESIHMLDASGLAVPAVAFYVMRQEDRAVGMGALKRIDPTHGEIKSMHVLIELRGRGLARAMLDHLIAEAVRAGFGRLSLETGSQPAFAPARTLYERAGFTFCPPFEGYVLDPNSVYMTRAIG